MKRKQCYLARKLSALRKSTVAAAMGLAIASGAAADPVQTLQIASGFMTTSIANSNGQWMLAAPDLSAAGAFRTLQGPYGFVRSRFPTGLGASVGMSWFADASDGLSPFSSMVFNGVTYNLTGSSAINSGSTMSLDASAIVIGHVGSYMEPFTFSAKLCGFLTVPMHNCDATVNLVGSGTLDLVVVPLPQYPGSVDFQSVSYRFAGVPEPATVVLLLTGLVGLGLTRRRSSGRQDREITVPLLLASG